MAETPVGLGNLSWQPALSAPDLLAAPVRQALDAGGFDTAAVFVTSIDPTLADTAAFCEAFDSPPENSANCVVVTGRRGEVTSTAACLVLATDKADVNKTVRKHLGVRKLSFAPMDEAVAQTGMEYGGITPVGLPADWPVLVDAAVADRDWIVIGSGLRGSKLAIPGALAGDLPGAELLELALR
ncbi:YbaK/EbsC family protein [Microlunatus soli]|uniref:Cys-tRNA(Pro) deacylase, prolyl-tRNA editing enzyme YbaK/EbsC n=1 Tax=Microlunatus soli TaxID=630515 RepID=A0A1H1P0A8_9ACTN|nr:YbaK/EbsC family protein [Microlunatus soli]SDS04676.1 Cys-tRNA(Pro) deacylase, prolyl-tRNA editing enzyme YbaK/EbsC [Microlunatus soli]